VKAPAALPVLAVQEESAPVDERPEVEALLDELGDLIKGKGEKDQDAIATLDKLLQEFPASGPKDRAAIVKGLGGCFDVKRRELEDGVPNNGLYIAAATALGTMAPESVKPLTGLLGHKSHRKDLRLQQTIALSLGKTKSPDALKPLLSLLKHKDAPMQAAGAEALGNYFDADLDTRKEIFEELLKTLMDQKAKKEVPTDEEAQERWNTISGPIIETLQKLSRQVEADPDQWLRWWNDNKKKDWGT